MKNKTIIIIASVIFSLLIFGFITKPTENAKYDYILLMQLSKTIGISTTTGYSEIKTDSHESQLDASALLKLVEEYQRNDYEVVSQTMGMTGFAVTNSILIRKPR